MASTVPVGWLEPGTPQWRAAWAALNEQLPEGERVQLDPAPPWCAACNEGECWQYMGTFKQGDQGDERHSFRHRMPKSGDRQRSVLVAFCS